MQELSKSHKARIAIRTFKVLSDALMLRGYYKPSGKTGSKLSEALNLFSPEIYGSMSDPRIVELKGLEYVIDRMPRGIEKCNRIILTAQEDFHNTSFEEVIPPKRRRLSYIVSDTEICFVITRGLTEVYDILTHITFLNIESQKIFQQISHKPGDTCLEWHDLEKIVNEANEDLQGADLDQALWNLSIIVGRTYKETRKTYEYLEENRLEGMNNGLFAIVHAMGERVLKEVNNEDEQLAIFFTPSLQEMIGHHKYASNWAESIKSKICQLGLQGRPVHLISSNMHSVKNLLYGPGSLIKAKKEVAENIYEMIEMVKEREEQVDMYACLHGYHFHQDQSGSNIDVNIIDTSLLDITQLHPKMRIDATYVQNIKPIIVVMDYAFGTQAFQVMDELLCPCRINKQKIVLDIQSISIMGKAGILPGKIGDIMLASAHVMEGTPHNYIVNNDLRKRDFDESDGNTVYCGPMVTVLGTSLQNRDVLERFQKSSWKAIGIEMEGAHYQRAINAAIIQGHIPSKMKTRYAYYASDNPLISGHTLASGPMGDEGIKPTYMITKVILEKILHPETQKTIAS